jgi:hypothetical protein
MEGRVKALPIHQHDTGGDDGIHPEGGAAMPALDECCSLGYEKQVHENPSE